MLKLDCIKNLIKNILNLFQILFIIFIQYLYFFLDKF